MTSHSAASDSLILARWISGATASGWPGQVFMREDGGNLTPSLTGTSVVLAQGTLMRARTRLARGATQVLMADAALGDLGTLRAMATEFGAARVGASISARREAVSWSMDTVSNCDFKCVVPSNPEARWEVLDSRRQGAGVEVGAWVQQLVLAGVGSVLISVDMGDDRDLDLCAGLIERFGPRLWFSPLDDDGTDLAPWVEFGRVRRLVLPQHRRATEVAAALRERFRNSRHDAERAA